MALAACCLSGCGWAAAEHPQEQEYRAALLTAAGPLKPIYSAKTTDKTAALTFDISWGEKMAPKVLDVLKAHDLKATFFLSGPWAKKHPELVARIVADGHEVQSHGQAHVNYSGLSQQGVVENIQAAHAILHEMTGKNPNLVRPPNGDFDQRALVAAQSIGYRTVIWSLDSRDWMNPGVGAIIQYATVKIHPGAIVLLHASDSCKQTDQALPTIIDTLRRGGYKLVLLTDLLQHGPDPNGRIH